ncbi:hypothetical protein [Streptomyces gilvus]|uniref:hypothetical protein n=1 Tax=Streptomyces gilvus TaxID=2920937 RepID=UPI001F0FD3DD|nr:hypothetical protein [Streptomyces sp. CME 23]MCH5675316.1 hypothetical protein [Streptomyces sp. CME 23]
MGVFARLLRRSKATEGASTAAAQDGTPTAQSEAVTEEPSAAKESAEANGPAEGERTTKETDGDTSGEGVEIPQQQSAEDAADSEAGESART